MNRLIKYCILLFAILQSCEEIYTPDVDVVDTALVVDARIVSGRNDNTVSLFQSMGYNDERRVFPPVSGASAWLVESNGTEHKLGEISTGKFVVNINLKSDNQYKLKILHEGDTFESSFEAVPPAPEVDTVYGEAGIKLVAPEGSNKIDEMIKTKGIQLYTDILNKNQSPYSRFTARVVMQYVYTIMVPTPTGLVESSVFCWSSFTPFDVYNIAAPDRFTSSDFILKHPLYFLSQKPYISKESHMENGPYFSGWILILYQHGLSEPAYNFYADLNKQLEANGKMFDPLYVQARNNLKCISNKNRLILGNFEISTASETRYFVNFLSERDGYVVRQIPYFYDIPEQGEILYYRPDFWETRTKDYPEQ